jgi:hypothetical protein
MDVLVAGGVDRHGRSVIVVLLKLKTRFRIFLGLAGAPRSWDRQLIY